MRGSHSARALPSRLPPAHRAQLPPCYAHPTLAPRPKGTLLSLGSIGAIAKLLLGNPLPFAFKYTAGNVVSLASTAFLVGPTRQLRGMLAPERRVASLAYIAALVGTLVSVLVLKLALLSLVFVLVQAIALAWYVLSYIPMGHAAARRLARKLVAMATGRKGGDASRGRTIALTAVADEEEGGL